MRKSKIIKWTFLLILFIITVIYTALNSSELEASQIEAYSLESEVSLNV